MVLSCIIILGWHIDVRGRRGTLRRVSFPHNGNKAEYTHSSENRGNQEELRRPVRNSPDRQKQRTPTAHHDIHG